MAKKIDLAPFAIVIGVAVVLQLALIGADSRQTPAKIARQFAEAYYYINPEMQDYLCHDLADKGVVDNFLYKTKQDASQRGFSTDYLRQKFTKMHLIATQTGDTTMTVHLMGTTRTCIHAPFMVVGKIIGIGRDYHVDAHIDLVKENGHWRVCGNPFGINSKV